MELNETIITDMGILSNEVYNDQGQKYFEFNEDGTRIKSTIVTVNGTYTIIDSTDIPANIDPNSMHSITGMEALLLRAPDGSFVIAFRGTETKFDDILTDFTIFLTSLVTGTGIAWNAQRSDAELFVSDMIRKHSQDGLTASNLTLTGHSLGGILAQTIASTQNLEAYTFNALGTTGLTRFENPNGTNILNLSYTDDGWLNGDPLSNAATFWGNSQVGEVLPMIGADLGLDAHGMGYMNAVIATYNFILESFIRETTYRDVTHAYLENGRLDSFFSNTYEKTNQYLFTDVNIGAGSSLSFNFFNYLTASQIEQQAKSDRAVLFALTRLNGFAVEGSLGSYSNIDLANYSSLYIEDRSLLLYHMLDQDNRNLGDLHIKDRGYGVEVGSGGWILDNPNILFGYDGVTTIPEELIGGTKADHLFGMGGDDILNGYDGNDYLEGGQGNDIVFGGKGYDTYFSGDDDTIMDDDGKGEVLFENSLLTGGTLTGTYETFKTYDGDGGMYILRSDGTLIFSKNGNFLTINDYHKESNSLGIQLKGDNLELSIFAPVVQENAGVATGAITLSHAYSEDVIVTLYTQDESATAGSDYVGRPTFDVRITAGETYVTFDVSILNDENPESTETFYTLIDTVRTAHGAHVDFTLTDVQSFTIEDDDTENGGGNNPNDPNNPTDPKYVTISVSDAQAVESGGTISFVVSLSEVLTKDITIDFITQDGSAHTGDDYVQYGRYGVTIQAGQRSAVYQVVLLNDEIPEDTEYFTLTPYSLSYTGSENVLLSNSATGTIYDDDDPQYVTVHISDASAKERAEHMSFTVSLSKELERDISISTSLGDVIIAAGERSGKVYSTWNDDTLVEPDESFMVALTGRSYSGSEQVLLLNTATGTIIDDDPEPEPHPFPYNPATPQPHDPLVLDMNQDGKISTIALSDSQVFFDITGDGVKEKVGWIAPQDGLLVYDKNMNGKIDGIGEVFGKDGISGFAELRALADSNYDNIIDRRDVLFSQLKAWQDTNGDGLSQADELKSLSQAGVKNIEQNVIGTNINLNGNLLTEAGRYSDSTGEQEWAAIFEIANNQNFRNTRGVA